MNLMKRLITLFSILALCVAPLARAGSAEEGRDAWMMNFDGDWMVASGLP